MLMRVEPNGAWTLEIAARRHKCDVSLAKEIMSIYPRPLSTADIGCGIGAYCKILSDGGWQNVIGYDATVGVEGIPGAYERIFFCDLTKEMVLIRPFLMILCLEVGEHIPKEFEQMFLNNVTNMAIKDIVMSWAPPGQGGTGHVNLQEQSYVLEQMAQRGFCIDQEKTEKLRMAAEFKYFQKNLIALRRVP
jgi:hypothetical protein